MGNSTIHGATPPPVPHSIDKAYGQPTKTLGGLSGGPTDINMDGSVDEMEQYAYELKAWLADVMESGQQVSDADWNQIMQYVQYTSQALGGGWDPFAELGLTPPVGGMGGEGMPGETGPNANEAQGGFVGVLGNYVYNKGSTHIEFIGSEVPHDIYTDEFTLDVPYESANVTVEVTEDTRIQPPENVLKITVTDPMVGATTVYYVHDYEEDGKSITLNTADGEANVTFIGNNAMDEATLQGLVEVGEYKETDVNAVPQSSHELVPDANIDDQYSVTAAGPDDVIELMPQPNGESDPPKNETFLVNGNSVITVPMDAVSVAVTENTSGLPPGYPYTMVVTHADGSTDTFMLKGGSLTNHINALPEIITMGDTPMMDADGEVQDIPEPFEGDFTIYTSPGEAGGATSEAGQPGDTPPSSVNDNEAIYEDSADVSLTTNFDSDVNTYHITASGTVTLNAFKQTDQFHITTWYDDNGVLQYKIVVTNPNEPGKEITYWIAADQVDAINLANVDEAQVTFGTGTDISEEQKEKIQIGGAGATGGTEEDTTWPGSTVMSGVPSGGSSTNEALELVNMINDAMISNNWEAVLAEIGGYDGNSGNNIIRKVITAIYLAAGSDAEQFDALMDQIPSNVRQAMKDKVMANAGEASETQTGDQWNSATTASKIGDTLVD
jgi:hypothetical protein